MPRSSVLIFKSLAVLGLAFSLCPAATAQAPQPDRIAGRIVGSPLVWLEGNRRPLFQPENDQGPVAPSLQLENVSLMFKLTESQQADLTALLADQQDPTSPNYHRWLTPQEYADRFGLSQNDVTKVAAWLQSQGFQVTQTARSRTWVSFSGTAAQIQSAFQTEIHNYSVRGKTYYGNASEPAVPAALADLVQGISALDNYPPRPHSVFREVDAPANPEFTSYVSGKNFLAPADFAVIYDVNALYNGGIDGTGESIAIMGQTDLVTDSSGAASDVARFRSLAGLPVNPPQVVLVPGVSNPGVTTADIPEATLDVEWAGAVARKANIVFVNGGSNGVISKALPYAIDQNLAPVISISYGNCESNWASSDLQQLVSLAQQANAQGITIVAAAGDSGAADCDNSSSTNVVTSAAHGLAVDAPASLPYVTGMGGTRFDEGAGNYWLTAPNGVDVSVSALANIPGVVWNDTTATAGLLAGGGGISAVSSKPSWQTGQGVPSGGGRDVPDLSLNASSTHDSYLVCLQGSCVNGYRNPNDTTVPNGLKVAGGTSAAAPTFGGIVALINQRTHSRQGNINPTLYPMAAASPAAFHDVSSGSNAVPCTSGTTDCPSSGRMGYNAGPGYDLASGLGSVDAYNLVTAWGSTSAGNLAAPSLMAPANGTVTAPLTSTFSWTQVVGAAGYRIRVTSNPGSLTTNPALAACSGCAILATTGSAAAFTPAAGALSAHTLYYWQVQALEPASSHGTAAWSEASVFNTGTPDFSLGASPTSLTLAPGGSNTSTLTLNPEDNFQPGNVTFTCAASAALAGVTCTVGTLSGNNTVTVTVTASTTARTYPLLPRAPRTGTRWLASLAVLGVLLMVLLWWRERPAFEPRMAGRATFGMALAVLLAASLSCGGGSSNPGSGGPPPPPSPESGTVTVTGTSGSVSHSAQISVSVS